MNELTRAAVILGAVGVGLAAIRIWSAVGARSLRRSVRTEALRPWPAVVLFSSNDCDACEPVRAAVAVRCPREIFREVAYQGSSDVFRAAGIGNVPSVVVIDDEGEAVAVFEGQVPGRRIGSALRKAGIK